MSINKKQQFCLVLHIGMGKTGTSSIQRSLELREAKLNEEKTTFLGLMLENAPVVLFDWQQKNKSTEFFYLLNSESEEQIYQVLTQSIQKLQNIGYSKAIWSNEAMFGHPQAIMRVLKKLNSDGHLVDVIAYVRRHEDWIQSSYAQWGIRHKTYEGAFNTFKEWIPRNECSFYPEINNWLDKSYFRFNLRNYDAVEDIVKDFFEALGLNSEFDIDKNQNITPTKSILALWAAYNNRFNDNVLPNKFLRVARPSGILKKTTLIPCMDDIFPTTGDLKLVQKKSQNDKKQINQILKEQGQPPLTEAIVDVKEEDPVKQLWEINMLSLNMIYSLQEQVHNLRRRIEELEHKNDK